MNQKSDSEPQREKPWLADYESLDYRRVWMKKGLEDASQKRIILDWLPAGERCLELGSGFGRITAILETKFNEVMALELSVRSIRAAKRRMGRAYLARADIANIPVPDSTFDSVVMVRVMQLLSNPKAVMEEVARVSKSGAVVIVSMPNLAMNNLLWSAQKVWNSQRSPGPFVWPYDRGHYFVTSRNIAPNSLRLVGRRGTGLFDNPLGELLRGWKNLYLFDVATSFLWLMKLDIFMKFRVEK